MTARAAAERRGRQAEAICVLLLRLKGYRILARRLRSRVGEIDILASRGKTLVAIEVKARDTIDAAAFSVSAQQRARITRAASLARVQYPRFAAAPVRFDVMLVAPRRWPVHLRDAFPAEGP